jgi:hypothetical protein
VILVRLFIDLTPLIPLSSERRGGNQIKEELTPLLDTPKSRRVKERRSLS